MTLADLGPVLLIGAGKMGGAMLEGWLARGLDPSLTTVLDPAPPAPIVELANSRGVHLNPEVPGSPQPVLILLAVKPQLMGEVLPRIATYVRQDTALVSIAAGKTLDSLAAALPEGAAIIRAMPNTPASVGRGVTVCVANDHVTRAQSDAAASLLQASGEVLWIDDESQMDAVTAVSGSGPAYVFWLAECMAEAGIEAGLPADLAHKLARETVIGAGELMYRSGDDPARLRENVTSPGGTTAEALAVLMAEDALRPLVKAAVEAAVRRSRELAE